MRGYRLQAAATGGAPRSPAGTGTAFMDSLTSSLFLGIAAGSANVLGGVMVVARRGPWDPRILHGFVALGAGFMLAAALLRMAPEAVELTHSGFPHG